MLSEQNLGFKLKTEGLAAVVNFNENQCKVFQQLADIVSAGLETTYKKEI